MAVQKFLLMSPRIDLTFTNKLFFTTIVQYNTRYDNVGAQCTFSMAIQTSL